MLERAANIRKSTEYLREISEGQDYDYIIDYFIRIKDKIDQDEQKLY
jgi:uncharacterized protein affecting Mg2+/Co2+ transport